MATEHHEGEPKTALNIVLLPDKIAYNKALLMSSRVSRHFDTEFILNSTNFRPHITLYQGYYPDRNIPDLLKRLKGLERPAKPIEVIMDGIEISSKGSVFWNCINAEALQNFHEQIVGIANPFRVENAPTNVIEGVPRIGDLYHPHLTLTRLKNPVDGPAVLKDLGQGEQSVFEPHFVTVANLGSHGTISDIVTEIPFR